MLSNNKKKLIIFLTLTLFVFISLFSLSQSNSLLETGIGDYKKGQYSFAINNLKKYIQIIDDNIDKPKAYYYLSLSYYFIEKYKLSLQYLNELSAKFRLSSYSAQSHFWRGLIYQNLNEWEEAEQSFLKYIEIMPKSDIVEKAYIAAANSEIALGKFDAAANNLKIIITKHKKSAKYEEACILYSYILIQMNNFQEAEELLMKWIGKLGKTGNKYKFKDRFWLYSAELFFKKDDYEVAKSLLKKIDIHAKNSPSSDIALLRLSQIENILGNSKDSKAYLIRLANEHPNSKYTIDATLAMGTVDFNNENYSNALVFFRQACELSNKKLTSNKIIPPDERERLNALHINSLFYVAEAYYKTSDISNAIMYFEKLIKTESMLKNTAIMRLIEIQLKEKNMDYIKKIITRYNSSLMTDKKNSDKYLLYKTKIDIINKDYYQAQQDIDQIKDTIKYRSQIASLKTKIFVKQNKIKKAINTLEDSLAYVQFDEKPYIVIELISLYFNVGNYKKVISYNNFINTYSENLPKKRRLNLKIKANYHIALSFMQLKKNEKGINLLKPIIKHANNKSLPSTIHNFVKNSFYYLGWMYYKRSDYIKAAENFKIAKSLNIKEKLVKDSYFMEAWCFFSKKDFKKSAQKFEKIYKKYYPDNLSIKAYFQMGKSLENTNNKSKALNIYEEIYKSSYRSDYKKDALYEIIKDSLNKKDLKQSNKLIKDFGKKFPKSELYKNILLVQAETLLSKNRFSEALSIYIFYIKNFKNSDNLDTTYYWAGYCANKTKDYGTAKNYLNYMIKNYNKSSLKNSALSVLLEVYNKQKDYKNEETTLKNILKVEKDKQKIKFYKKRLRELNIIKKGYEEEEANLIIKSESKNITDQFNLAKYYYQKKDKTKGLKMLKEITKNDSKVIGSTANQILGDEELDKKNYEKAVKLYLNTLSSYRTTKKIKAEALYKSAFCYFKLGNNKSSKTILKKLRSDFSDTKWAKKGLELEKRIK